MEFIPFVPAFIVPAGIGIGALISMILGGAGAGVGAAGALGAFGSGAGGATPPIDPYTGQVMGIDPNTGLNQRVVDTLWNQPTPEGYQYVGEPASYIDSNGLPKWITSRLEWAQGKNANWLQYFKDNLLFTGQLPAELVTLLTAPWGTIESDNPMYRAPQPNEGQEVYNPAPQEPQTFPEADISTTVHGNPQYIPPELAAALGGAGLAGVGAVAGGSGGGNFNMNPFAPQELPLQQMPIGGQLTEPNPNNVPDYVAPPPVNNSMPYFYEEFQYPPIISTPPVVPPVVPPPMPLPGAGVPTQPPTSIDVTAPYPPPLTPTTIPTPGTPTTTTPPVTTAPSTPGLPEIPNIPISGGGGGAAIPPAFPVVGDGNALQSLFQALPPISVPPSIVEFMKRRQA